MSDTYKKLAFIICFGICLSIYNGDVKRNYDYFYS